MRGHLMERTYSDIDATLQRSRSKMTTDPRVKAAHRMKRSIEWNGNSGQRLPIKFRRIAPIGSSSQIKKFDGGNITLDERPKPVSGQKTTVLYHFVLQKKTSPPYQRRLRAGDVVHTTSQLWAHTSPMWSWDPDNTVAIYAIRVSHEWLMATLAKQGDVYFGTLYPKGENSRRDERAYGTIVLPAFVARVRKVRVHDLTVQGVERFIDSNEGSIDRGDLSIPYITLDMVGIKSARAVPSRLQPVGGRTYLYTLPDSGSLVRIENPSNALRERVMNYANFIDILDDKKITFKNRPSSIRPDIDDVLSANFSNIIDGNWNTNSVNGREVNVFHYARPHAVQGARSASARRGTKSAQSHSKSRKSASARRATSY